MPAISAVRTACGLVSPVISNDPAWANARTSLMRSAPNPMGHPVSKSTVLGDYLAFNDL